MLGTVLSILMLAALALVGGAAWLWRKPSMRRQALLMLVLALIALINVAIWTLPDERGRSPAETLETTQFQGPATSAQHETVRTGYSGSTQRTELA